MLEAKQSEKVESPEPIEIEVEQKQRGIYVKISCKDPLDALDLAHACLHVLQKKDLKPEWKVLP
jgi:hypothetical protein